MVNSITIDLSVIYTFVKLMSVYVFGTYFLFNTILHSV